MPLCELLLTWDYLGFWAVKGPRAVLSWLRRVERTWTSLVCMFFIFINACREVPLHLALTSILERTMKHLAATGIVTEVDRDVYRSTPFSAALTVPSMRGGVIYGCSSTRPSPSTPVN
jgi:hypothetical protein